MESSLCSPFDVKPTTISADWPICTGYLENTLAVFQKHHHPFVLVGSLAMRWSGANPVHQHEIDVLVRSSEAPKIITDLIALGEWELSTNYATESRFFSLINESSIPDTWLESCIEDPWHRYLRLWPEELYKMSIDCEKIEVFDVDNNRNVLVEEEYHLAPFCSVPLSKLSSYPFPPLQVRAKLIRMDLPIFIPKIKDHLNALLDQRREEIRTGFANGNEPVWHIGNFIRYLYVEWAPYREWILEKVHERNRELLRFHIDSFKRKPRVRLHPITGEIVYKMPWEQMPWEQNYGEKLITPEKKYAKNHKCEDHNLQKKAASVARKSSRRRKLRCQSSPMVERTVSYLRLYCGKRYKWQKLLFKSILITSYRSI